MSPVGCVIDLEESLRFAALSADFNPLHVDPVRARRLPFGGAVVHGVSILMRALDIAFAQHGGGALARVHVQFDSPIATAQPFEVDATRNGRDFTIRILNAKGVAQRISATLAEGAMPGLPTTPQDASPICRDLDFEAASAASGELPLAWDAEIASALYPALAAAAPAWQLAALAATTRIVGMECPGLHSTYTELDAAFALAGGPTDTIAWRVAKADKRFRFLRIEAIASQFTAKIDALMRPVPVVQPALAEVCALAPRDRFAGRRALVVGGSRGLGEVAAKILAAGGAEVAVTYVAGAEDAETLVKEITTSGGKAHTLRLDVLSPPAARPDDLPDGWTPTDLLYFASPQIVLSPGAPWNDPLFQRFCSYFVGGFAGAIAFCDGALGCAGRELRIFYPSTVYVGEPPPGGAEYAASKGAAEAYCAFIKARRPKTSVTAPRLPRMLTDQTSSVRSGPMEQPLAVLLGVIS